MKEFLFFFLTKITDKIDLKFDHSFLDLRKKIHDLY